MELELGNLPRFTANTKVVKEENGQQLVAKHKIRTYKLPEAHESAVTEALEEEIRQRTLDLYCKQRVEIEEEIRERQAPWRTGTTSDAVGRELPSKTKQRSPKISPQKEPEAKDLSLEPPPQWSR